MDGRTDHIRTRSNRRAPRGGLCGEKSSEPETGRATIMIHSTRATNAKMPRVRGLPVSGAHAYAS